MSLYRVLSVLLPLGLVLCCAADRTSWDATISSYTSSDATLKKSNCSRVLDNVPICLCDNLCHADPRCRGVAYSSSLRQCRISPHHPTLSNTETTANQSWLLAHRRAPGMANETCRSWTDCHRVNGPARCRQGRCVCDYGFQLHFDTCLPADGELARIFDEMSTGVPDPGSLLASVPHTPPAECERKCLATPNCLVINTTTLAKGDCSLFARLKSYSVSAGADGMSVRARRFPHSEGEPTAQFRVLNDAPGRRRFAFISQVMTPSDAALNCRRLDSVLYPAHNPDDILAVFGLLNITVGILPQDSKPSKRGVLVGVDKTFNAGNAGRPAYVSSNSRVVTKFDWNAGEPSGIGSLCTYVNVAANYRFHDVSCTGTMASVCMYLGSAVPADWHSEDRHMIADLGAVYDVKEVRYVGAAGTATGRIRVHVSLVPGEEKECAVAAAALAAPPTRSRRLICGSTSYGRFVHLRYDSSVSIEGDPAVYGIRLYGP